MPSSFTPSLRLEIQATGENDTSWGDKTNVNLEKVLEPAIAGAVTITMENADYTLSVGFAQSDEARNAAIIVTGTNSAVRNVICPAAPKLYVVRNITSGGHSIVFKTQNGTGVTVLNGETYFVFCDGGNVIQVSGDLTPSRINSGTTHKWRFNGAMGLNRDATFTAGYGSLALDGTTASDITLYSNGTLIGKLKGTATAFDIESATKPITMTMGVTKRFTLDAAGKFTLNGPIDINDTLAVLGTTSLLAALTGTTATFSGNVSAATLTHTSDERYKRNWKALPDDIIEQVAAIDKAGVFEWTDGSGYSVGIGAQSLEKVLQQAVHDNAGRKTVNSGGASMALIVELCRAVSELRKKA